jgi:polysaccharide export outer membrane protein
VINVELSRKRYTVMGASNSNVTQDFSRSTFSLADALARAGGLANRRADKRGVFLFREAPRALIVDLGADVSSIQTLLVPTIFQFDMSEPTSLFTISKFQIESDDVIYISDSATEEVNAAIGAITAFIPAPVEYVRDATIPVN